ncbi:unannotated protein [freshwater metagenome]|uniref:Unannotated protein n=1 Tax=freshwater metagenome TaxID=449393 RepID=A0A6J7DB17_9ZZZZ|nr:cupin [Actinomycetota bacterium]
MTLVAGKRFDAPDEVRPFSAHGRMDVVELDGGTVGRGTFEPGWRWSDDVKPLAGTESCEVPHVGFIVSGSMTIHMDDGSEMTYAAGEVLSIPPGHDAWTEGDEACVMLDFGGVKGYAQAH